MENASKALLIAASVLVVILVIAFSMTIFNSNTDSVKYAENIGGALQSQSSSAVTSATTLISGGKEITFKISEKGDNKKQFKAKEGMTWEEFIKSGYNYSNYFSLTITGAVQDKDSSLNDKCYVREWDGLIQRGNMTIKSGYVYISDEP